MREFDFSLEDIERRVSAGVCSDWREITVIVRELIELKKRLKRKSKKDEIKDDE